PGATRIAVSRAAHGAYVELLLRHGAFVGRIAHAGASCGGELVRPGVRRPSEPEGERRDRTEVLRLRLWSGRFTGSGAGHHSDSGVAVQRRVRVLRLGLDDGVALAAARSVRAAAWYGSRSGDLLEHHGGRGAPPATRRAGQGRGAWRC